MSAVVQAFDPESCTALGWAHPVVQEWFLAKFGSPTEPQIQSWPCIVAGRPALISAPTGSGKTLAAFLVAIDRMIRKSIEGSLTPVTEVVYISPLKALSNDVQKNLLAPLAEIQDLALARGYLCPNVRAAVRTGDTLPKERAAMLRNPPHILVTTPESLYILLTAEKSRSNLRFVRTVIVDEIHAIADDKRGTHLTLTLERLDALVRGENQLSPGAALVGATRPTQRIGLSATQNPIDLVADYLTGAGEPAEIIQVGQRRDLDLAIEIPDEPLGSIATRPIWDFITARLAHLAMEHRSTLVFVNTRAMVERMAFQLGERIGTENVAAHHGSLSRALRLEAERKLQGGEIRILFATASLELGIDIGNIDLVCQIHSPRSIAAAMQRVGRAGHWRGALPKGRFFVTTRDDLVESAALIQAMRAGALDVLELPEQPLDVLMQQMVACCAAEPWSEDSLYALVCRAHPYRSLPRRTFDELVTLLSEGIASSRGPFGAWLLRDRVHARLQARRGARLAAVCNGGTIPDTAIFQVLLQPEGVQLATLDEHFAVDSSPGDVILLGNTSWRITKIETAGRVFVEDAQGQPPNVPFWTGEAPQRTMKLSEYVASLRKEISNRTADVIPGYISQTHPQVAATLAWLCRECHVNASGAEQLIAYIVAGRAVLGTVPTLTTIVAERFFDQGGGMQLILHAPFGGRINKAWGLALRKRFCRGFNFELQAAATDNGLNISLAEQHSFPLADVFRFLTPHTVTELLQQASLTSPIFRARWRWDATRSLQLLRFQKGKKVPPQIMRTRGDDLLANVFPQVAACQENIEGDIEIPDHPLVREVMKDVLQEAMDLRELTRILADIDSGAIRCVAVDTVTPSQFAHELLNANPYAYLDDAPQEERRARAVALRGAVPDSILGEAGRLSPAAIAEVRQLQWPDPRDEHEFHDLLTLLILMPATPATSMTYGPTRDWQIFFDRLVAQGRATVAKVLTEASETRTFWVAAERAQWLRTLWPSATFKLVLSAVPSQALGLDEIVRRTINGWLSILGPATARGLAQLLGLQPGEVWKQLLHLEVAGTLMRGIFENYAASQAPILQPSSDPHFDQACGTAISLLHDYDIEWCDRRLLQRIHQRTLGALRKQVEPVSPATYLQWLLSWQHVAPQSHLTGEQGVLEALRMLEGFEAAAVEWERSLLPSRVAGYDPRWLDKLCLSGHVGWGRISPHPAFYTPEDGAPRRVVPTCMAPITFFLREEALWMDLCLSQRQIPESALACCLSELALKLRVHLTQHGATFAGDLVRQARLPAAEVSRALWELVAAGLITADGFDSLRRLINPRDKYPLAEGTGRRPRAEVAAPGRWGLLVNANGYETDDLDTAGARAERREAQLASACTMLLRRYGILFRDLLDREANLPKWRDLHPMLRRMEARGQVRGGRFVSGFSGEQFALPEALESLREARRRDGAMTLPVSISAADPLNLFGIIIPGDRIPSLPGKLLTYDADTLSRRRPTQTAADMQTLQPYKPHLFEESHL